MPSEKAKAFNAIDQQILTIPLAFVNEKQKQFVEATQRNQCFNGGYGNGKTYAGCMKLIILAATFPKTRWVIGRWRFKDLMNTTVQTFFKLCHPSLYDTKYGGKYSENRGYVRLINGSEFLLMHFDDLDENAVKSLECNGILLDQAEEIGENIYLHLDARVGRWDMGEVPQRFLDADPNWPRNVLTNRPIVPQYSMILCNPADEGELHWIWQRFHPDSLEKQKNYPDNFYIEATSRDNVSLSPETLAAMESRDPAWKDRFVLGKWGKSGGTIHTLLQESILDIDETWFRGLMRRSLLFRIFDHGGSTPACCLWVASCAGQYFVYREYYVPGLIISEHRRNIEELSCWTDERGNIIQESYSMNVADPDIFVKRQQNRGGFYCVADEYADDTITDSSPIVFTPADNNEYATRNRIHEVLRKDNKLTHPITGEKNAPKLFFLKRNSAITHGCFKAIQETKNQKYQLLDTINGKPIYSDERDKVISDHAYDCVRYFCAIHANFKRMIQKVASPRSFNGMRARLRALKQEDYFSNYGLPRN